MKKMKCLPVHSSTRPRADPGIEYTGSSSEYYFDDDVVDAPMLLFVQPDGSEVYSPDSAVELNNDFNGSELRPDHPSRVDENRLLIVSLRKHFCTKDDGYPDVCC